MATEGKLQFATEVERIAVDGGELILLHNWLNAAEARNSFLSLREKTAWEQSSIVIAGKTVAIPRLNAWYGDEGKSYSYSGTRFEALPWYPELHELKRKVQDTISQFPPEVDLHVNSALLNLYRDGNDSVGWHSDDEAALGPRPQIASVSLGATRRFLFKHRHDKNQKLEFALASGSLLLMFGDIQKRWRHCVPKTRKSVGERINLTFRQIVSN